MRLSFSNAVLSLVVAGCLAPSGGGAVVAQGMGHPAVPIGSTERSGQSPSDKRGHSSRPVPWRDNLERGIQGALAGKLDTAEQSLRSALLDLTLAGSERDGVARCCHALAWVLERRGRAQEAEALEKRALAVTVTSPANEANASVLMERLGTLARIERRLGHASEAEQVLRQELGVAEATFGRSSIRLVPVLMRLSVVQGQDLGNGESARRSLERGLEIQEKALGPGQSGMLPLLNALAALHASHGDHHRAERYIRRAMGILESSRPLRQQAIAEEIDMLAISLLKQGKHAEAEALFRRAMGLRKESFGEDHPAYALSLQNLAGELIETRRYLDAEPYVRQAVSILERTGGRVQGELLLGPVMCALASILEHTNRQEEALAVYSQLLRVLEGDDPRDYDHEARVIELHTDLLRRLGRTKEADSFKGRLEEATRRARNGENEMGSDIRGKPRECK